MKSIFKHYCVQTYDGKIVYEGRKENKAAVAMEPGTVCGQGYGEDEARWDAQKQIAKWREAQCSRSEVCSQV